MNKIISISILAVFLLLPFVSFGQSELNYGENLIIDSDLDGLTDLGEKELFGTDPNDPDSDGDGMLDGAEIIGDSDPKDSLSPVATKIVTRTYYFEEKETPWVWYFLRASGLVAFLLLYSSMLFGLFIIIPFVKRIFGSPSALEFHKWISIHSLVFAFVHGIATIFEKQLKFSLINVFIPFTTNFEPLLIALGSLGLYLLLILVVTSLGRRFIPNGFWRSIHYLNIFAYLFVAFHVVWIGTDLQTSWIKYTFFFLNLILFVVFLLNIFFRLKLFIKIKTNKGKNKQMIS